MTQDNRKHDHVPAHGSYERQDLQPAGIVYFLLGLAVVTVLCIFGLRGLYSFLDHRERGSQAPVSPLITSVPEDPRHVAPGYPQGTFPNPQLEEDERGQLNGIRMAEEKQLYSYGMSDEKAGTVHIPIERAMDLIVERGLPVRPQGKSDASSEGAGSEERPANPQAKEASGKDASKAKTK
jgi:hypothetical protein